MRHRPLLAALLILGFSTRVFAWCNNCNGSDCCGCPGEAQCLGSYATCEEACGMAAPSYYQNNFYRGPSQAEIAAEREAARQERQRVYQAAYDEAAAASERGDYREALRLFERVLKLRDGPNVRETVLRLKAVIPWVEAKTTAERRRAYNQYPAAFTRENLVWLEAQEKAEQFERDRPQREAEAKRRQAEYEANDREAAKRVRKNLENIADSYGATGSNAVVLGPTTSDAFGGQKAAPSLEFGDPASMEAASDQARQGWDDPRRMIGTPRETTEAPPVTAVETVVSHDPRMIAANEEIEVLSKVGGKMDADIQRLTEERNRTTDPKRMKAATAELDKLNRVKAKNLTQLSKAKEKKAKVHQTIIVEVNSRSRKAKEKEKEKE